MPGKISPKRRLAVAGITTACVLAAAVPAAAQTGGFAVLQGPRPRRRIRCCASNH